MIKCIIKLNRLYQSLYHVSQMLKRNHIKKSWSTFDYKSHKNNMFELHDLQLKEQN